MVSVPLSQSDANEGGGGRAAPRGRPREDERF